MGVQVVTTILRREKERRKESKDVGVLEAKDDWQTGKIPAGNKQHTKQD